MDFLEGWIYHGKRIELELQEYSTGRAEGFLLVRENFRNRIQIRSTEDIGEVSHRSSG
jgi:hypothetical protein